MVQAGCIDSLVNLLRRDRDDPHGSAASEAAAALSVLVAHKSVRDRLLDAGAPYFSVLLAMIDHPSAEVKYSVLSVVSNLAAFGELLLSFLFLLSLVLLLLWLIL